MNSFLNLYTSSDYRVNQRDYHKSTWEYINVASDYMIPFQWDAGTSDAGYTITKITTTGAESSLTGKFLSSNNAVTGWTLTGSGNWTVASDSNYVICTLSVADDYITSNQFTLTADKPILIRAYATSKFSNPSNWNLYIEKNGTPVYTVEGLDTWTNDGYYTPTTTGSDYTYVIKTTTINETIASTAPAVWPYSTYVSGNYHWYAGGQLIAPYFTDIFRIKIEHNSNTFYSDWMDPIGFTGLAKIKLSSSYDYGGIKYVDGYEQWMYKDAVVRRSPKAEIEIIGDTLNGERQNEKITSAVKYTMKMKCTESEWEALVHAIGGTIEITDHVGKTYDVQNVELSDPTWHHGNAVVEMSFVDGNNINTWNRNNSDL